MKKENRRRSEGERKVRNLERAVLSLRDILFSRIALRRGVRRLRRWGLLVLGVLAGLAVLVGVAYLATERLYSLGIEEITYESRQGVISKEQALDILGLKGAGTVNLATLDVAGLERKLEADPCVASAHVRAESLDTLHIEVDERIPVVYVEMASAASAGRRARLFMGPEGALFPIVPAYHERFLGVPTWYLQDSDIAELKPGAVVPEDRRRPVCELVAETNRYDLAEIPRIVEILRPKDWKLLVTLETGTEVLMQVYDIREQVERLAKILDHARVTHRHARSIDVIPRTNPTVIFSESSKAGGDK